MTRVDVETVMRIYEERRAINSIPLEEVEWYKDGKPMEIRPGAVEDFKFTGLSNTDFILCDYNSEPEVTIINHQAPAAETPDQGWPEGKDPGDWD